MRWIHGLAFVVACAIAAQPCLAAGADGRLLATGHAGAFAGASFTLPFGGGHARPTARLELSPAFAVADPVSGETFQRRGAGFSLGLTRAGKPDLRFAGRGEAEVTRSLGFKGSTGYIVVGGVLLLVVLLAAVANAQPKPGPRPGDF